jgi:hypothetical protein
MAKTKSPPGTAESGRSSVVYFNLYTQRSWPLADPRWYFLSPRRRIE